MNNSTEHGADTEVRPLPEPVELPRQWLDLVSGGLNPQPLPPRRPEFE